MDLKKLMTIGQNLVSLIRKHRILGFKRKLKSTHTMDFFCWLFNAIPINVSAISEKTNNIVKICSKISHLSTGYCEIVMVSRENRTSKPLDHSTPWQLCKYKYMYSETYDSRHPYTITIEKCLFKRGSYTITIEKCLFKRGS
jgi:hypothetical protein